MNTHRFSFIALFLLALIPSVALSAIEGRAWGDIHLQTMDGARYDFQGAGEYVASRSTAGDLEVQLRLEPTGFGSNVSLATAVALLVDTTRASVVLGREPLLFVDGQPATLPDEGLELPDGGRIEPSDRGYQVIWADGSSLSIDVRKKYMNAYFRPAHARRSTLSGLFGNFNGIAADDVDLTITGVGSNSQTRLQAGLADLARTLFADEEAGPLLAQKDALFEYEPGQSTYSYRRPTPTREASPKALSASWRRRAEDACKQAGVTDAHLLTACIVDVGYTRDESFVEAALAVQERGMANWDSEMASR